jgi:hypothetical protein
MKGFFTNLIRNFNQDDSNKNQNSNNNTKNKNTEPQENIKEKKTEIDLNNNKKEEEKTGEIVIVNENPIYKKEGHYYKKYINNILQLKTSEPIFLQRQKMTINFDKDVIGYFFNDITQLFQNKSTSIKENQKELFEKISKTMELVSQLSTLTNFTEEKEVGIHNKEKKLMEQIDYLDTYINSLSIETDKLLSEVSLIEEESKKLKN